YAELDRLAKHVARRLREAGVKRGSIVGLCVERSPEMYVGLLAILKSGAAYVPLDPAYPMSRLRFILDDSGASVLVAARRYSGVFAGRMLQIVDLDDLGSPQSPRDSDTVPEVAADDAAYVIYTSGSTGTPKGVVGSHHAVVNRLLWMWETFPYGDGE